MISVPEIQLNVCAAYIAHVKEKFPVQTYESNKLLLILEIYQWHLKRFAQEKACTYDQLMTLKTGIRQSEVLLRHIAVNDRPREAQHLSKLLWAIILELTKEVDANERLYPELKPEFDRERAQYREMLEDALEAEQP